MSRDQEPKKVEESGQRGLFDWKDLVLLMIPIAAIVLAMLSEAG